MTLSSSLSTALRCLTWAAIAFGVSLLAVLMTIQRCISTDICPHRRLKHEDEPTKCRFTFTKVREHNLECAFGCCKCIALAEISVYGSSAGSTSLTKLNVSSVSNPGGRSPPGEGPGSAVDGQVSTKLVDKSFAADFAPGPEGYSVLELELERVPHDLSVSAYSLVTADDAPWRDPVEWGVRCWSSQGLELADAQSLLGSAAPSAALAAFSTRRPSASARSAPAASFEWGPPIHRRGLPLRRAAAGVSRRRVGDRLRRSVLYGRRHGGMPADGLVRSRRAASACPALASACGLVRLGGGREQPWR